MRNVNYKTHEVRISENVYYTVTVKTVENKVECVTVKKYPDVYRTSLGKDFTSFESAINNYKNTKLKSGLKNISEIYEIEKPKVKTPKRIIMSNRVYNA